jgi:hypothetical protein
MTPESAILRAVDPDHPRRLTFCGYCGHRPQVAPSQDTRVCGDCGLGLLLTTDEGLAPAPDEAFLVVDAGLTIRALSQAAERLFALAETDLVDQPLENVIVPAESTDTARTALGHLITGAAHEPLSPREPDAVVLRPARTFGIRYSARIGRCEPGRAALLVFDRLS